MGLMKKISLLSVTLFFIVSCTEPRKNTNDQVLSSLHQLVEELNYFELQGVYLKQKGKLTEKHQLYFEAILANAFNQPERSKQLIDTFFSDSIENDTLAKQLLQRRLTNHIHLSEYAEALHVNEMLRAQYTSLLGSGEVEDLDNTHKIWRALKTAPPQRILKNEHVILPITKDKAGLSTIETKCGDTTRNFVFDTGANFSVIQKSEAEAMGMRFIPAGFNVEAATGLKVKSDLAVAEQLELGSIVLKNVVFLVFEDAALSFPSFDYEIKGIIGFPVIRALEEIQLYKNGQIRIPKEPTIYNLDNLALDEYMPIVKGGFQGENLLFNFDTGAQKTSLFYNFFQKYKREIEAKYKKETLTVSSAGGEVGFEGYVIDDFILKIGDAQARLDSLQLSISQIGQVDRMDGNLGQDFIQQFDTMIISFKFASILFQ